MIIYMPSIPKTQKLTQSLGLEFNNSFIRGAGKLAPQFVPQIHVGSKFWAVNSSPEVECITSFLIWVAKVSSSIHSSSA